MQLLEPVSVTPPFCSADVSLSRDSDQALYAGHTAFSPTQDYRSDLGRGNIKRNNLIYSINDDRPFNDRYISVAHWCESVHKTQTSDHFGPLPTGDGGGGGGGAGVDVV